MKRPGEGQLLVIACGALAREIEWLRQTHHWDSITVKCLNANLHNTPAKIPEQLEALIKKYVDQYEKIFVAFGDCGTGGAIDRLTERWEIERLPGAHCYAFYAGESRFDALAAAEPGTFYLTDFLVQHFDRLVVRGLKLDRYPQLMADLFGHYRRVVYLAQRSDGRFLQDAQRAADYLGLEFESIPTGMGELGRQLETQVLRLIPHSDGPHAAY